MADQGGDPKKNGPQKDKLRGTTNELEIMVAILESNPALRNAVLDKLRAVKDRKDLPDLPKEAGDAKKGKKGA